MTEGKKRAGKRLLFPIFAAVGIGICYFVWLRLTNIPIPCLFYKLTGYKCPGCGITTMIMCVSRLDFAGAFEANPFLFVTGIPLLAELIYCYLCNARGQCLPKWNERVLTLYTAALMVFGVVRNIL